jgi:hypothetical protein
MLARYYEQGIGCKKSPENALVVLRDLAEVCTCAYSLCQLAKLHHFDLVTTKEALKLLQQAVVSNPDHGESWYEKGLLHRSGKGLTPQ